MVFLVWHEYVLWSISFQWVLGLSDSFIPFAIGATQFYVFSLLKAGQFYNWFGFIGMFSFCGWMAYKNMFTKINSTVPIKNPKYINRFNLVKDTVHIYYLSLLFLELSSFLGIILIQYSYEELIGYNIRWCALLVLTIFLRHLYLSNLYWKQFAGKMREIDDPLKKFETTQQPYFKRIWEIMNSKIFFLNKKCENENLKIENENLKIEIKLELDKVQKLETELEKKNIPWYRRWLFIMLS